MEIDRKECEMHLYSVILKKIGNNVVASLILLTRTSDVVVANFII